MSFDKIFDFTGGVYFNFYNISLDYFFVSLEPSALTSPSPAINTCLFLSTFFYTNTTLIMNSILGPGGFASIAEHV